MAWLRRLEALLENPEGIVVEVFDRECDGVDGG
jgi:hypothetical protein